jgi:hypothetical protein
MHSKNRRWATSISSPHHQSNWMILVKDDTGESTQPPGETSGDRLDPLKLLRLDVASHPEILDEHCAARSTASERAEWNRRHNPPEVPEDATMTTPGESTQATISSEPKHRHTLQVDAQFACTLCDRRFTRKANLDAHLMSHAGGRPYTCTVCGRKFQRSNDCRRHEKTHEKGLEGLRN